MAISAPTNAKMTITTPVSTFPMPSGANPPSLVRWLTPPSPPVSPSAKASARQMNAMIAATLIEANQNSNSP